MRAAEIDRTFVPRRAAAAYTVELDGEAVILDEDRNRLHHLNPMATLVWACFDGTGSIDEIAADLARAFTSEPTQVARDVLELARDLGSEGLLDGVDDDKPPVVSCADRDAYGL
jgi:hypothetical protein